MLWKLGASHDVKGFAIGSFLERIVVERANDDLCLKNVKNAGLISRSISSEFSLKITTKLAVFYHLFLGNVCPENSQEIGQFFWEFVPKNPAKFDLFFTNYEKPMVYSIAPSIRFENIINRSRYIFGDKLALFMRFGTFFIM